MNTQPLLDRLADLDGIQGEFYTVSLERYLGGTVNTWESYDPRTDASLSYSDLETTAGRHCGWRKASPEEIVSLFSERKLWPVATLVFCPNYFLSGDYCGSLVELSNLQTFLEEFGNRRGVWEIYGSHSSSGLAIDVRHLSAEMIEDLAALQDYPVRDEDHLSHLELEKEGEAWDGWVASDLLRSLSKAVPDLLPDADDAEIERLQDALWDMDSETPGLFDLVRDAMERGNLYWETEGISRYLDVDRVVASIDTKDLMALIDAATTAPKGAVSDA